MTRLVTSRTLLGKDIAALVGEQPPQLLVLGLRRQQVRDALAQLSVSFVKRVFRDFA